ncbi:MAG: hypothetical protein VB979_09565 [Acinetobacter sp.]|jgi:hypothetical protein|uniref:hypothetical protein n=1 Tax=Acinetobacter sp. TaxID=472 RepID=UPI003981D156
MNGTLILGWIFLTLGMCCWANAFYSLFRLFRTRLLLDLPLDQKFKDFNVTKKGGYAIWQEGPLFKCAPMTFVYPQIINTDLQQLVKLSPSIGRASKNGFSRASMLMFYCELEVGNYRLDVMAGSSLNPIEEHVSQVLIKNLSIKQAPDSQYNVQIRESLTQKQRAIMFICLFAGLFLFIKGLFTVIHLGLGIAMEGSLA